MAQNLWDKGDASFEDFKEGVSESTFGDVNAIKSVLTTGGTMQDWLAVAMLLTLAGGKGKNALQNNITDTPNNKKTPTETDTSNNKKNNENASVKPKNTTFDTENQNKKGQAFSLEGNLTNKQLSTITENAAINKLIDDGYTEVVQIQNNSGHGIDVIGYNPKMGEVKCIEVKSNNSKKSRDQQKGGEYFVNDRLKRAISEEKFYRIPPNSSELKADAMKAQEWIDNAENVKYEEWRYQVDKNTGSISQEPEILNW